MVTGFVPNRRLFVTRLTKADQNNAGLSQFYNVTGTVVESGAGLFILIE